MTPPEPSSASSGWAKITIARSGTSVTISSFGFFGAVGFLVGTVGPPSEGQCIPTPRVFEIGGGAAQQGGAPVARRAGGGACPLEAERSGRWRPRPPRSTRSDHYDFLSALRHSLMNWRRSSLWRFLAVASWLQVFIFS